jgi:SAM-dependent methyltransferase
MSAKNLRIYEAGGGWVSCLPSDVLKGGHVTVVDIDEAQLQRNKYAKEKILGDIQTREFAPGSFDLIVCYNVIEHLNAPDRAIDRFYRALTPGGLLFIAAPNPESLSGWITKITPHWFNVQFYRWILGYKDAGQPACGKSHLIFYMCNSWMATASLSKAGPNTRHPFSTLMSTLAQCASGYESGTPNDRFTTGFATKNGTGRRVRCALVPVMY